MQIALHNYYDFGQRKFYCCGHGFEGKMEYRSFYEVNERGERIGDIFERELPRLKELIVLGQITQSDRLRY